MASDPDDWAGRLAESEEQLAALDDSPDPVAQRQITEALYVKGRALSKLNRPAEAIEVWDELLLRLAAGPAVGVQRFTIRVLSQKALELERLGKQAEAVQTADALLALSEGLDQRESVRRQVLLAFLIKLSAVREGDREQVAAINTELVRRFASSDEPLIHEQVTTALVSMGVSRLVAGQVEAAIDMCVELSARIESAPDEVWAAEAELLSAYARCLIGIGGSGGFGIATAFAFVLTNVTISLGRSVLERLSWPASRRAGRARMLPASWILARRRLNAAIQLQDRITSRIGGSPDPELERVATVSRMQAAAARILAGDVTRGFRELSPVVDSSDPASVQPLQNLAASLRGRPGLVSQLDELFLLSLRAEALGAGDVNIQQIAYEDSIEPLLAETRHRSVRWLAVLMTPGLLPAALAKPGAAVRGAARKLAGRSEKG